MIITISGKPGSGKSTVGKLLAKKLGYEHFSTGDFMREMASERGVTILELNRMAMSDPSIDDELDRRQAHLGREEDDFVLDARLGYHFIPHSYKVFLDVDLDVAAARIAKDHQESRKVEEVRSISEAKTQIRARMREETRRYQKLYHLDPYDTSQYNLVIDTTGISIEEVIKKILTGMKTKKRAKG